MKKTLYIDMDGVIVDFYSAKPTKEEIAEYGEEDCVPNLYAKMIPMSGALKAVEILSQHFDVYLLSTAPWNNPSAWTDKLEWVKKYLPVIGHKRLILSHNKHLNIGDYLIDDRPEKNGAGDFEGELLHFGEKGKYKDWQSVLDYLVKEEKYKVQEYQIKYDKDVMKTWDLLSPIIQLDNPINKVDTIVYYIVNRININYNKFGEDKLTFDIMIEYVEDELFNCLGNYESEFVEEVIKTYNSIYKFYEDDEE